MKKLFILAAALALSACAHKQDTPDLGIAPPPEVPVLPDNLKQKAVRLPDITDPTLAGAHIEGAMTDRKYNDVAIQLNQLIDIYECIRVSLKDRKDPKICFGGVLN